MKTQRGFKGTSTGLGSDDSRKWMPEVLFQPQISGPRNKANCKPIEPTQYYDAPDMDVFRHQGANDEQGGTTRLPKPPNYSAHHPIDWRAP